MERANSPQAKDESESTTKKSPPIESTTRNSNKRLELFLLVSLNRFDAVAGG
jgi:hypothetical protein